MVDRIFIDVKVWLDWLDESRPRHSDASLFFQTVVIRQSSVFISDSVLTTVNHFLSKTFGMQDTIDRLFILLSNVELITAPSSAIARTLENRPKDVEDAVLETIAVHHSLDFLVTNDRKGFGSTESIHITNPLSYIVTFLN